MTYLRFGRRHQRTFWWARCRCHPRIAWPKTVLAQTTAPSDFLPFVYSFCSSPAIHELYSSCSLSLKSLFQQTSGACRNFVHPPGITAVLMLCLSSLFVASLKWHRYASQTRILFLNANLPITWNPASIRGPASISTTCLDPRPVFEDLR